MVKKINQTMITKKKTHKVDVTLHESVPICIKEEDTQHIYALDFIST